ncbi:hypothetical protein SAMN05192574_11969 [Mucilaginibacter gossypiicola]|uniref:DoxX protein n=1 Tax=Mucilaginibacter gossypiicola TaxID=551995 RepID=A0A1H8UHW3_9SPHI|nr:hypothetical protein [Mucilaginibacter gossypiicola]SEP02809.1 hypothetical protein SAMN05192574_11969 [Mucilaginibacter gossypiicola]
MTATPRSYWFAKFFECVYLLIAIYDCLMMMWGTLLYKLFTSFGDVSFARLFTWIIIGMLIFSVVYSIYWNQKSKEEGFNSEIRHAFLRGVMRYFLAFQVSAYGFAKILKTQFGHVYMRDNTPVGKLSGFDLTWNYFGHSYTFAIILGLLQIGGSVMLLFRRTTLLGTCLLLPIMLNIVLINVFYDIAIGAFINSIIITTGLLYLLLLRWPDIKPVLFKEVVKSPLRLSFAKPVLKLLVIVLAFYSIYRYVVAVPSSAFAGKWKIQQFIRNGKTIGENDWMNGAQNWCYIYIEDDGRISFCANPYVFEANRAWFGRYSYNAKQKTFDVHFDGGTNNNTTRVKISNYNGKQMQWDTKVYDDTLKLKLVKE